MTPSEGAKITLNLWNRHPIMYMIGIIIFIAVAIFALPVVLFCVISQISFIAAVFVLNLILPRSIMIAGFDLGSGFLNTGIGSMIGFILLIARWTIDIIRWAFVPANIVFAILSLCIAVHDYHDATNTLIAMPGEAWAYFISSPILKGVVYLASTLIFGALLIHSIFEGNGIKQQVRDGTYVRQIEPPKWLAWAKVENVYGQPTPKTKPEYGAHHHASTVPTLPPEAKPETFYEKIARENREQASRK